MSAFVNQAVRHELQHAQLGELLAELEDELGPPDEAMVAEALRFAGSPRETTTA